ncbi:MAG: class I tRNA ligase family protein, partial [Polaromonas sp.]|nr:class I tRNA ligase family protein [Polaromonas sp.]
PLARFWMHNGFVRVDNEKKSKSVGNFFKIKEVLAKYDPETVRFFLLRTHYRSALNYSDAHLDDARTALKRLYTVLDLIEPEDVNVNWTEPFPARFKAAMDEDFGTPEAAAVLFDLAGEINRTRSAALAGLLLKLGGCLGLLQRAPRAWLQGRREGTAYPEGVEASASVGAVVASAQPSEEFINRLIADRAAAKAEKHFAEADRIRQELVALGIVLKDSPAGTTWEARR